MAQEQEQEYYVTLTIYNPHRVEAYVSIPVRALIATTVLGGLTSNVSFVANTATEKAHLVERLTDLAVATADALIDRLAGKTS